MKTNINPATLHVGLRATRKARIKARLAGKGGSLAKRGNAGRANKITLICALALASNANADTIRPLFSFGYDAGGERLGTVFFDDGTKENVNANEGLHLAGGFVIPLMNALALHTTIGFQTGGSTGDNGDMTWLSFPWETTLAAQLGNFMVGGGTIYHFSPQFNTDGALRNLGDYRFDDALGYQAQIAWSSKPNAFTGSSYQIGLRYSSVEFENKGTKINGDSTGIFVKYLF